LGRELDPFQSYVDTIDSYLTRLFPPNASPLLSLANSVLEGGKRVRPLLALLACESVCGDHRPAIPIAAAYELAHSAALIQDDIMDVSPMRRGLGSVWAQHGARRAMLIVDALLFTIPQVIADYVDGGLPSNKVSRLLRLIGSSAGATASGEHMDLELTRKGVVGVDDYLEMAKHKTGALLAASSASGALVGNGSEEEINRFYEIGETLGTAYQVTNDIVDIVGDPQASGKQVFNDIRNGKKNIVLVYALESLAESKNKEELELLNRALSDSDLPDQTLMQVKQVLVQTNSVRKAEQLAKALSEKATSKLAALTENPAKPRLALLSEVVLRTHS